MGQLVRAIYSTYEQGTTRLIRLQTHLVTLMWIFLLLGLFGYSHKLNRIDILQLPTPVSVKVQKDNPAYLAFELLKDDTHEDPAEISTEQFCETGCKRIDLNERLDNQEFVQTEFSPIELQAIRIERPPHINKNRLQAARGSTNPYQLPPKPSWQMTANQPVRALTNVRSPAPLDTGELSEELLMDEILADEVLGKSKNQRDPEEVSIAASRIRLRGHISLSQGLALTDQMSFSIQRQENGMTREKGEIFLRDGKYEITVDDYSGMLVAQLKDKNGQIIGKGVHRLVLPTEGKSQNVNGPEIVLSPSSNSVAATGKNYYEPPQPPTVASARSAGRSERPSPQIIKGMAANIASGYAQMEVRENNLALPDVNENSFALLRAQAPEFYQTNQIVSSERHSDFFLYPVGMMKALREIVAQQRSSDPLYANLSKARDEEVTIIWGQILKDGVPQEKIDISLESEYQIKPVYFNEFQIPDPKLQATSKNGLFAFLGPAEGLHSLVARKGLQYVSHTNVFVEAGAVAVANLETTSQLSPIQVRSYDAFTGEPRPLQVQMQSVDYTIELPEAQDVVYLPQVQRLSFAEAPGDAHYAPALFVYNDVQESINLPAVSYQWVNAMADKVQKKTGQRVDGQLGTLVGFVPQEEFVVQTWGGTAPENVRIFYFDQSGEILEQPTGVAGGGFIIFNIEDEYKQVSIDLIQSQTTSLRIFPIDPGKITIHPLF